MTCIGTVVHCETFAARSTGEVFTKLFVPVGHEVFSIISKGNLSHLVGMPNVPFRLGVKDKELKLYYDGKEDD